MHHETGVFYPSSIEALQGKLIYTSYNMEDSRSDIFIVAVKEGEEAIVEGADWKITLHDDQGELEVIEQTDS